MKNAAIVLMIELLMRSAKNFNSINLQILKIWPNLILILYFDLLALI